jgi:carboxylesterase
MKTLDVPSGVEVMEDGKPFFFEGGTTGCLLIHGFTGTTSSMKMMGEYFAERGLTVLAPRLPGHGTNVKDMGLWSCGDWKGEVERALAELKDICSTVFVSGLSMGGTLTLYLAERFPEGIAGIMPISAPVFLKNPALKLVGILKHVITAFPGPGGDIKDPGVEEVAYDKLNVRAAHEMVKLMRDVRENLHRVSAPVRIFQAGEDHVVPPENAPFIYDRIGSKEKEIVWLDNSYHVATLDFDKEKIFEASYGFITGITGSK